MPLAPRVAGRAIGYGFGNKAKKQGWLEGAKIFLFIGFPIAFTILQSRPEVMGFVIQDREYVRFPAESTEEKMDVDKVRRTAQILKQMKADAKSAGPAPMTSQLQK